MAIQIDGEVLSGTRSMTVAVDVVDQEVLDITPSPTTISSSDIVFIRNAGSAVLIINGNTDQMFNLEPGGFLLLRSPSNLILICGSETLAEVVNISIPA
jgi:hypothetical protein